MSSALTFGPLLERLRKGAFGPLRMPEITGDIGQKIITHARARIGHGLGKKFAAFRGGEIKAAAHRSRCEQIGQPQGRRDPEFHNRTTVLQCSKVNSLWHMRQRIGTSRCVVLHRDLGHGIQRGCHTAVHSPAAGTPNTCGSSALEYTAGIEFWSLNTPPASAWVNILSTAGLGHLFRTTTARCSALPCSDHVHPRMDRSRADAQAVFSSHPGLTAAADRA